MTGEVVCPTYMAELSVDCLGCLVVQVYLYEVANINRKNSGLQYALTWVVN